MRSARASHGVLSMVGIRASLAEGGQGWSGFRGRNPDQRNCRSKRRLPGVVRVVRVRSHCGPYCNARVRLHSTTALAPTDGTDTGVDAEQSLRQSLLGAWVIALGVDTPGL